MGLRILASVETPQGFTASALYLRIMSIFVLRPQDPLPLVKIRTALYLSRDRQTVVGSEIDYPAIPREYDIELPLTSVSSFELLYAHIRAILRRRGFTCETVAEDGQTVVEIVLPEPEVLDVSGSVFDASGEVVDVSGAVFDASGAVVDVSGSVFDASGAVVDVSGSVFDASGEVVDVSGSVFDASGEVVDVSGSVFDASGEVMDVSGASPQSSESTQSTPPTPPTPSESAPQESQPEPQPQSSSEYAPAPEASEA